MEQIPGLPWCVSFCCRGTTPGEKSTFLILWFKHRNVAAHGEVSNLGDSLILEKDICSHPFDVLSSYAFFISNLAVEVGEAEKPGGVLLARVLGCSDFVFGVTSQKMPNSG